MAKPAIVAVDDDPQVASAVARDLRNHYAADYRIVAANSGAEALDALGSLQERGNPVALLAGRPTDAGDGRHLTSSPLPARCSRTPNGCS